MGIDLNQTILTNNAGLVATFSGSQAMKMAVNGTLQRYNLGHPMFRAGYSGTAAAIAIGPINVFTNTVFNATNVNVGGCYNPSNGAFTAPVAGVYLFTGSLYFTGGGGDWLVHSAFFYNGGAGARPGGLLYRIHGFGQPNGYAADSESFEIIPMAAGDFVTFAHYVNYAATTHVAQYGRFEGYLLN